MDSPKPAVLIFASAPECLSHLCGISLVERLLRVLQRLGFARATVFANSPEVAEHLSRPSWARAHLTLSFAELPDTGDVTVSEVMEILGTHARVLMVRANFYYDARLLQSIARAKATTILIDSSGATRISGAALISREWLSQRDGGAAVRSALKIAVDSGEVAFLDAAQQPTYVTSMRRDLRPFFFPSSEMSDRVILDAAQNGTLDLPALVHAPIETALVSRLCRTAVTPNQVTLFTLMIGLATTFLFALGHLWPGAILALIVGVLDGIDGKLARVKVETTELGSWEHSFDYFLELSWWTALASWFQRSGQLPTAYGWLSLLFAADLCGRLAKRSVKQRLLRNLDDVSAFDRIVRYVAGRRNIYVWIFATGLLLGHPATAFIALCAWGAVSAVIHAIRAVQIGFASRLLPSAPPLAED